MDQDNHDEKPEHSHNSLPDKGKGKAEGKQDTEDDTGYSIVSRLQNSARMAGGTFVSARAGLPDMPTSSEGKVVPSVSGALSSSSTHDQSAYQSATRPVRKIEVSETFRQSHREAPASSRPFDSFVNAHQPLPDVEHLHLESEHKSAPRNQPPAVGMGTGRAVVDAEATDGSAVADLLSQPDDLEIMAVADEQDETLSAEDATKLRAALFNDTSSSGRLPWDHLLNFTPDSVSATNPSERSQIENEMQLGTADSGLAADIWLRQWHDVLSAYTDEVWGDLGTLVQEVKSELERDLSSEGNGRMDSENPALSRLKMILAHVRGSR